MVEVGIKYSAKKTKNRKNWVVRRPNTIPVRLSVFVITAYVSSEMLRQCQAQATRALSTGVFVSYSVSELKTKHLIAETIIYFNSYVY